MDGNKTKKVGDKYIRFHNLFYAFIIFSINIIILDKYLFDEFIILKTT